MYYYKHFGEFFDFLNFQIIGILVIITRTPFYSALAPPNYIMHIFASCQSLWLKDL